MRRKLGTALLLFTLSAIGCTGSNKPCFPPASLVLDTRVLAVQSDPPEAVVDPSGVDPIAPVNIAALVVSAVSGLDGEYGRAAQQTAEHTSIYVCLAPTVADVNAQPGCPGERTQIADLTAIPTMANPFGYTPPLSLIQQAIAQDPVHGLGGVKLLVQLDFVDASTTPSTTFSATKTLSFQLKGSLQTLNHGLVLTGMETSVNGVHTMFPPSLAIGLVVTQVSGLRPLIGPGAGGTSAIETYLAYNNSGVLTQFEEHVTYAFYAGNALFFGTSMSGLPSTTAPRATWPTSRSPARPIRPTASSAPSRCTRAIKARPSSSSRATIAARSPGRRFPTSRKSCATNARRAATGRQANAGRALRLQLGARP